MRHYSANFFFVFQSCTYSFRMDIFYASDIHLFILYFFVWWFWIWVFTFQTISLFSIFLQWPKPPKMLKVPDFAQRQSWTPFQKLSIKKGMFLNSAYCIAMILIGLNLNIFLDVSKMTLIPLLEVDAVTRLKSSHVTDGLP